MAKFGQKSTVIYGTPCKFSKNGPFGSLLAIHKLQIRKNQEKAKKKEKKTLKNGKFWPKKFNFLWNTL